MTWALEAASTLGQAVKLELQKNKMYKQSTHPPSTVGKHLWTKGKGDQTQIKSNQIRLY